MNKSLLATLLIILAIASSATLCGRTYWQESSLSFGGEFASASPFYAAEGLPAATNPASPAIIWQQMVNCELQGRTLKKTRGRSDTGDAGAVSQQRIISGNGYLEFTALETNRDRTIGLTKDFAGLGSETIDFALHLTAIPYRGGFVVEVRENGAYQTETTYQPNTNFRIAVEEGKVTYYKNGESFHVSKAKPAYPLAADVAFLQLGATIANAVMGIGGTARSTGSSDKIPPVLSEVRATEANGGYLVTWNTNEPATAQVEYGKTNKYENRSALTTLQTTPRINLVGLTGTTKYYYRIRATDAAGNETVSNEFTFVTGQIKPSYWAGLLEDHLPHLPANYETFQPGSVGSRFTDSAFGATITRLSDGLRDWQDTVHHEYSTMSPFNKDSSLILLQSDHHGFYIVDRKGELIVHPEHLVMGGSSEPRWSYTDPNVFYYHDGNQLKQYSVLTKQKTLVKTFSQFQKITWGGGEGDISEDGDHLMIVGDQRMVGMYTFSTGILGRMIDLSALADWDEVYLTANNNVMVRWGEDGVGKTKGLGLFDAQMNFIRQVETFSGHSDQARDANGDEVILVVASRDLKPAPGCETNGVEKIRIADSKKTCLVPLHWDTEIHVSANSNGKNPWAIVSATDYSGTAAEKGKLAPDWKSRWKARFNELILARIDGTETRRVAHHRGRIQGRYWWQPRATISREGKYVVFDSSFGLNTIPDYGDAYLLNLTNEN